MCSAPAPLSPNKTDYSRQTQRPTMTFAHNLHQLESSSVIVKHVSSSESSTSSLEPVSRTYQYRKVMKPMLERKRRARINRCLDELKDLMVNALQSEGENVSKLEKADILELTVNHLHKLRRQQRLVASSPVIESDRFRAGFTHAANEVSRCLAATPGVDISLGTKLMTHLGHRLNDLDKVQPLSIQVGAPSSATTSSSSSAQMYSPASSPSICSESNYSMPMTPASSSCNSATPSPHPMEFAQQTAGLLKCVVASPQSSPDISMDTESVWRPW